MSIILKQDAAHFLAGNAVALDINNLTPNEISHAAIVGIAGNLGLLPEVPPLERHPYLEMAPLANRSRYFIGTFPPIGAILDHPMLAGIPALINGQNQIYPPLMPFFHGSTLRLWEAIIESDDFAAFTALPRPCKRPFIHGLLVGMNANYSDIITHIQRTEYNANDAGLTNIFINEYLIRQIVNNPNASMLAFDSSSTFGVAGLRVHVNNNQHGAAGRVNISQVKAFDLFARGCQELGYVISLRIPANDWIEINLPNAELIANTFRNKVIFEMKIENLARDGNAERSFTITTPPSVSSVAALGIGQNLCYLQWLVDNPAQGTFTFIQSIYRALLANNFTYLNSLNVPEPAV